MSNTTEAATARIAASVLIDLDRVGYATIDTVAQLAELVSGVSWYEDDNAANLAACVAILDAHKASYVEPAVNPEQEAARMMRTLVDNGGHVTDDLMSRAHALPGTTLEALEWYVEMYEPKQLEEADA